VAQLNHRGKTTLICARKSIGQHGFQTMPNGDGEVIVWLDNGFQLSRFDVFSRDTRVSTSHVEATTIVVWA
jgi:hypothetical protein